MKSPKASNLHTKSKFKKIILLNSIVLSMLIYSCLMYTSVKSWSPAYDSTGIALFSIFIISDPVFLMVGIALFKLSPLNCTKINKWVPFIAIIGNSLPILIDLSISEITFLVGAFTNIIIGLLIIIEMIRALTSVKT